MLLELNWTGFVFCFFFHHRYFFFFFSNRKLLIFYLIYLPEWSVFIFISLILPSYFSLTSPHRVLNGLIRTFPPIKESFSHGVLILSCHFSRKSLSASGNVILFHQCSPWIATFKEVQEFQALLVCCLHLRLSLSFEYSFAMRKECHLALFFIVFRLWLQPKLF